MTSTASVQVSPDLVDQLAQQHGVLLRCLDAAFAAIGTERYRATRRLGARLLAHLDAEHRVLDPVVRTHLDSGRRVLATLREHEERMRAFLGRLELLGDYAEEYGDVLTCFETHLLGHISVTEAELFPALRDVLDPADRRDLGTRLRSAREQRPEPSRPARLRGPLGVLSALAVLPFLRPAG